MPVQTRSMTQTNVSKKQVETMSVRASIPAIPVLPYSVNQWNGKEWVFGQTIAAKIVSSKELAELGYKPLEYINGKLKVTQATNIAKGHLPIGYRDYCDKWAIAPDDHFWEMRSEEEYYSIDSFELVKL